MRVVVDDVLVYTGDSVIDDSSIYSVVLDDSNFISIVDDGIMSVTVEDGVCC